MIRIIDAVDAEADYYSFRGTYARRYMGGNYWYPDGCDVESRRHECRVVGDAVVALTGSAAFAGRRKILIGFSQGGYLSYRMAVEHPGVFDAAILLSRRSVASRTLRRTAERASFWHMATRTARYPSRIRIRPDG